MSTSDAEEAKLETPLREPARRVDQKSRGVFFLLWQPNCRHTIVLPVLMTW